MGKSNVMSVQSPKQPEIHCHQAPVPACRTYPLPTIPVDPNDSISYLKRGKEEELLMQERLYDTLTCAASISSGATPTDKTVTSEDVSLITSQEKQDWLKSYNYRDRLNIRGFKPGKEEVYSSQEPVSTQQKWPYFLKNLVERRHEQSSNKNDLPLPPPTPCEIVEEKYAWWGWGQFNEEKNWLGHGYFWRPIPDAILESLQTTNNISNKNLEEISGNHRSKLCPTVLENAAGNSMNDFDSLELGFTRLKKAKVLTADYELLRKDFGHILGAGIGLQNEDIVDQWLLDQCAYFSAGQIERLNSSVAGDHSELLNVVDNNADSDGTNLNGKENFFDFSKPCKTAIRNRSGGRAATFFVDNEYSIGSSSESSENCSGISSVPIINADFIECKGIGTHINADITSKKTTGLLNLADALRELAFQRLIQKVFEVERQGANTSNPIGPSDSSDVNVEDSHPFVDKSNINTVKFYALIDTGLQYRKKNPATGWENERCVIAVRQRHSRLLDSYNAFSFAGMVCEDEGKLHYNGRYIREVLIKHGISAEFEPRSLFYMDEIKETVKNCDNIVAKRTDDNDTTNAGIDGSVTKYCSVNNLISPIVNDLRGEWNLQMDATFSRLMDFSDYYVLPNSVAPTAMSKFKFNFSADAPNSSSKNCDSENNSSGEKNHESDQKRLSFHNWQMSSQTLRTALTLETSKSVENILDNEGAREFVFGGDTPQLSKRLDRQEAESLYTQRLKELSKIKKYREAAAKIDPGNPDMILPGKPEYCMCWAMELDDSAVSTWISEVSGEMQKEWNLLDNLDEGEKTLPKAAQGNNLIKKIDEFVDSIFV